MLKQTEIRQIEKNFVEMISDQWMLIAAGNEQKFNCMTASWGGIGHLWNKDVVYIFIRPQRYTYQFIESNEFFSINVLGEKYRKLLNELGSKSGREIDKMHIEIEPVFEQGNVYYRQSEIVLLCRKIYFQDFNPVNFLDPKIQKNYPKKDYHRMYIGEIYKTLKDC